MGEILEFTRSEPLTLGVEMELQLVDPRTWDLKPAASRVFERVGYDNPRIKPELFQSMIELNTGICRSAHDVEKDLRGTLAELFKHCEAVGVSLASGGTHPLARYLGRKIVEEERYQYVIDHNQWPARRLMIFGLHVHLGMRDGEHCIAMLNLFMRHLYTLLALSASSPFWQGQDTGLASCRSTIFEALPTAGHPTPVGSWEEFSQLYGLLVRSGGIRSMKDLWWDLRPSPGYGTLEIRVCDALPTLRETVAITALIHALAVALDRQIESEGPPAPPPLWMTRENKWRASRFGLDAQLVVDETGTTRGALDQVRELLEWLEPIGERLHYGEQFQVLRELISGGGCYSRQRLAHERTHSLERVAELSCREFATDGLQC